MRNFAKLFSTLRYWCWNCLKCSNTFNPCLSFSVPLQFSAIRWRLEVQVEGVGKGGCPLKAQNLGLSLRVSRFFFATPALVQKEVEQKRQIIKLVCCPLAVHPLTAPQPFLPSLHPPRFLPCSKVQCWGRRESIKLTS